MASVAPLRKYRDKHVNTYIRICGFIKRLAVPRLLRAVLIRVEDDSDNLQTRLGRDPAAFPVIDIAGSAWRNGVSRDARNKRENLRAFRGCLLEPGQSFAKFAERQGFSPLLIGVATPRGIVRVQRVQQHGMTTGSLIVPSRRLHATLTGLPRPE